ncbi:MAG: hypothetical protein PHT79_04930 [Syntrophomonadaceae bacterium]|nr:hypothetical protein [Syntrophomonadaceae bacterium]
MAVKPGIGCICEHLQALTITLVSANILTDYGNYHLWGELSDG